MARLGLDRSVEINALPFRMKVRARSGEARHDNNEKAHVLMRLPKTAC